MLQAKSINGEKILLASFSKREIECFRNQKQFFCPTCNEQVIIKAGTKIIPHFAHRSNSACPLKKSGEGHYHEKGKLLLYQWLKKQQLQVSLEAFIKEINQRPDILLEINNRKIAIEFQCTRISVETIQQRNKGYEKIGIIPIWLLGANLFKRTTTHHLKLDQFTRQFIHQFSSTYPLTLYYFNPNTLQIIIFQHIYFTSMEHAIGKVAISNLNHLRFQDIFTQHSYPKQKLYQLWNKEKVKFRLRQRNHISGRELAWHRWLYVKGTNIDYLPSIIHLPITDQFAMNTPLWDWQSRLCLELLHPLPIGSSFLTTTCRRILRKDLQKQHSFPLIQSSFDPVTQYLQLLEQLNIVRKISPSTFVKIHPLIFHKNIEISIQEDKRLMQNLQKFR